MSCLSYRHDTVHGRLVRTYYIHDVDENRMSVERLTESALRLGFSFSVDRRTPGLHSTADAYVAVYLDGLPAPAVPEPPPRHTERVMGFEVNYSDKH